MKRNFRFYMRLFFNNLMISALAFGGGYVVIPMIRKTYVIRQKLFTERELAEMAAIAQSSPGAIAVNLSVLVGRKTGGALGALATGLATVLPPLVILGAVSLCYDWFRSNAVVAAVLKGMEAGVCALILWVVIDLCRALFGEKKPLASLLVPLAFVASFFFEVSAVIILLAGAAVLFTEALVRNRRKKGGSKKP